MNRVRKCCVVITTLCVFLMLFTNSIVGEKSSSISDEECEVKPIKASLTQRITSLLFVSSSSLSSPTTTSSSSSWDKLKTLLKNLHTHFFPPNLDFRGGEEIRGVSSNSVGSNGENVKGAMGKSFEKGIETVEMSAKTAAKIAEETLKITKDKVKNTFSKDHNNNNNDQQSEL
ncbi:uncharacterized protein LOC115715330 isoform X1 [Cannabis sativa]|uniref:Transmembrane protein n=1 Tax=Cannabis sativa TaxID=3483 RepID=A0A7J6DP10_CANSA|nr:uncharacterized protein LOC115715330 isoform X1 [Cannabis sativa]KAF4347580.1 hypothetical protein G4B88_009936 [Cannabis sativa]